MSLPGQTSTSPGSPAKSYFVDEAGDPTLFDRRGRVTLGVEGCSSFFLVGLADVAAPATLHADLAALRVDLLADPILRRVRQMNPTRGQTAVFFHAKDDPVEVRREVFRVLLRHDVLFSAVVRCKWQVLSYVRSRNRNDPAYHYHADELYDAVIRRLFKERLHRHHAYRVVFAIRGTRERTAELRQALAAARANFAAQHRLEATSALDVIASRPQADAGLQAIDYFLWALQRVYERPGEEGCDRYLAALWEAGKVSLVVDVDDTRQAPYGAYYTRERPLLPAALRVAEEYRIG